jgi:hypothetical protein
VTGLREIFFIFTKIDFDSYVGHRTKIRHEVKGIGTVRFQLEVGGFLVI